MSTQTTVPTAQKTTLKTTLLPREFVYNGAKLPDLNPTMTVEQVRDLFTAAYPEIATATVAGPEDAGKCLRYTFTRAIGSKG